MSEKVISAAYGILGIAVWGGTIGILIFAVVLFFTTQNKQPTFEINSLTVCEASETDADLISKTDSIEGWYKAEYSVSVKAARISPFVYSAGDVVFEPQDNSDIGYFLTKSGNIIYSATVPCNFELTLFIRCSSADEAREIAENADFRLSGMEWQFSILYSPITDKLPGFSVSELLTQA